MSNDKNAQDPLEFVRGMWNQMGFSLPGMVTPTLDVEELDKRITDMRAVEGWLKMNLNMLQMSIQGLEMQRAALAAVKAMSQHAQQAGEAAAPSAGASEPGANPFAAAAAMWPWNLMANPGAEAQAASAESDAKSSTRSTRRKPAADK
ncbi:PhaM family polyhydroxyalkanoate granule multifunctional regulatory protein [Thauera sp.]|uniref:PhaM family polyhydroxyalkanoate granule multifunctional regulatory protein n=1 Tax=Thauera sp. TaxID=1905334 RepID=UPI0026321533|nr:PhaM family polyhydroxyalkanoate granule multifunctional regulatory protein [Thauera sp.]